MNKQNNLSDLGKLLEQLRGPGVAAEAGTVRAFNAAAAALLWGFAERLPLRSIAYAAARAAAIASGADPSPLTPHDLTDPGARES